MDPHFHDRISVITGDLKLIGAGISAKDVELMCNEVQVVIHAAADVRFNIPLLELVQSNVRGTRDILEIAKKMRRLEVFSYISTAYSHCPRDIVEEKFYDPPMEPEFWLKVLERCKTSADREIIEILEQQIMNPWPNSYTYTKALSESLVKRYSEHFPTIVIRPSISTFISFITFAWLGLIINYNHNNICPFAQLYQRIRIQFPAGLTI